MAIDLLSEISRRQQFAAPKTEKLNITVFHCFNAANDITSSNPDVAINAIKMPCSSLTREVFLLRAFEAGADAVAVLVCPEGSCHYLEGNIRARKRVEQTKKILDEIGIDNRRLNIFNIDGDMYGRRQAEISSIIDQIASDFHAASKE
jgi:coenzyme F420-reducing hydrogenase delta subunit